MSLSERSWLKTKCDTAEKWAESFPDMVPQISVTSDPKQHITHLGPGQTAFLSALTDALESVELWSAKEIQAVMFDAARETETEPAEAFRAFYAVMFGSDEGPRAGEFLEAYGRDATEEHLRKALA